MKNTAISFKTSDEVIASAKLGRNVHDLALRQDTLNAKASDAANTNTDPYTWFTSLNQESATLVALEDVIALERAKYVRLRNILDLQMDEQDAIVEAATAKRKAVQNRRAKLDKDEGEHLGQARAFHALAVNAYETIGCCSSLKFDNSNDVKAKADAKVSDHRVKQAMYINGGAENWKKLWLPLVNSAKKNLFGTK